VLGLTRARVAGTRGESGAGQVLAAAAPVRVHDRRPLPEGAAACRPRTHGLLPGPPPLSLRRLRPLLPLSVPHHHLIYVPPRRATLMRALRGVCSGR
jgi:hypothetical protein